MDATRDQAWFEAVYRDHEYAVRQYAVRRVGVGEADSMVSGVFGSLWRHRAVAPDSLPPWLYRVAASLTPAGSRQPSPMLRADLPLPGVHQVLAQLPAAQAELLRLAHWERLDRQGIATVVGSRPAIAAARLRRAERLAADQLAAGIGPGSPVATVSELLRAADPAAGLIATPPEVQDARVEQIIDSPADSPVPPPPPRPRLWWPIVLLVSVALVAAAVFSNRERLAFLISDRAEWADEVLTLAADRAADPERRPGQYWRITQRGIERDQVDRQPTGGYALVVDQVTYLSTDRKQPICFDTRGGEVVASFGTPRQPPSPQSAGITCYSGDNALFWRSELPVDAGRLGRLLEGRAWGPAPIEEQVLAQASVLLGTGYLTAEQRAAVFEYLVEVPGVEVIHPRVEADDRAGLAIGIADPQTDYLAFLIIDQSGEFLGIGWPGDHRHYYAVRVIREVSDELPPDVVELACRRATDADGPLVCPR